MTEDARRALAEAAANVRAAWPRIELSWEVFVAHAVERLAPDADPDAAIRDLHAADLYLACACARGDARALEAFDRSYVDKLDATLQRAGATHEVITEVKQFVRTHLLVAPPGAAPRIAAFSGRGDLHGWLRIIAVREALRLMKLRGQLAAADDDQLAERSPAADPELDYLRQRYGTEFRAAFAEAAATLSHRERNLLRHRFLDDLNVDQIGAIYNVHRATAARWISRAERSLSAAVRRTLTARLGVDAPELDSILRLIESRLDMTIEHLRE